MTTQPVATRAMVEASMRAWFMRVIRDPTTPCMNRATDALLAVIDDYAFAQLDPPGATAQRRRELSDALPTGRKRRIA